MHFISHSKKKRQSKGMNESNSFLMKKKKNIIL